MRPSHPNAPFVKNRCPRRYRAQVSSCNWGLGSGEYAGQLSEVAMGEPWKQCEGQTVNGEFRLGAYLDGSGYVAVYQTVFGDPDPQTAAIKLIAANSPGAEQRLAS